MLAAGLLIQLSSISAQESESAEAQVSAVEAQVEHRDPYADEQTIFLDTRGGTETAAAQAGSGQSIWPIIRMVLVLVLVAVAIYGIVFLFKRSSKKTINNDPFLKVLAAAHLGSNRYVHIVYVGNKTWLLGASDGGVNLIGEVEDKDVIDAMLLEDSRKSAQTSGKLPDFLSILRRMGAPANPSSPSGADEIRKRRERLGGL